MLISRGVLCFIFLCGVVLVHGQKRYTPSDSVAIYSLLDSADYSDFRGALDSAMVFAQRVVEQSKKIKFKRGEAFGLLKIADLKLKMDGTENIDSYFKEA